MSKPLSILTWILVLVATATGLGQAWMRYLVEPTDEFSAYNHPWQGTTEALHALLGPLTALVLGMVLAAHATAKLQSPGTERKAKLGGAIVGGLIAVLVLSAAWMSAWPTQDGFDGKLLSWVHGIGGSLFVLGMAGHALSTRD